jgi:DNA-binding PadR family transcriptional regulator
MTARNRNNPLALAVLITLFEGPKHPYEVATTLRQRRKDDSVRLNYGSLYAVVASLERRGLISAQGTAREGRLPERTVYGITEAGGLEAHDWLAELISTPVKEYPVFEAGLSFLPALAPDEAVALLQERGERLELQLAQVNGARELVEKRRFPRLFWVEAEFAATIMEAELAFVRRLAAEIASGGLSGVDWWRQLHADGDAAVVPPPIGDEWAASGDDEADEG